MKNVKDLYGSIPKYTTGKKNFIEMKVLKAEGNEIKIRPSNKKLAVSWLLKKEEHLRDINGYNKLALIRTNKTLYKELLLLKNTLYWFNSWNLKTISELEIKQIFQGLETGQVKSISGKSLSENTKKDYYKKVFKGVNTFFAFLGKNDIAKKVIKRRFIEEEEVRFFEYDTLIEIVDHTISDIHKLLYMLMFDTGIELNAVLQLRKSDFVKYYDEELRQDYYKVNARQEISKKHRQKRNLDILDGRLNNLLVSYLKNLQDDDLVFNITPQSLRKKLNRLVKKLNLKTRGEVCKFIRLKDFRSSCANFLLDKGFSTEFIKVRLGHKFSSKVIDRYLSYRGINQEKVRKEITKLNLDKVQNENDELKMLYRQQQNEISDLKVMIKELKGLFLDKTDIDIHKIGAYDYKEY